MSIINAILSALSLSSAATTGKCDIKYPNGTDLAYNWYNCDPGLPLQLQLLNVTTENGQINYPVDLSKSVTVDNLSNLNFDGSDSRYDSIKRHRIYEIWVDAKLSYWDEKTCDWILLPTFTLLNNINGCELSKVCPFKHGRVHFNQEVNLGPFAPVISTMAGQGQGCPLVTQIPLPWEHIYSGYFTPCTRGSRWKCANDG